MHHDDIPTIMITDEPGISSSALFWPTREPHDIKSYKLDVRRHIRGGISKALVKIKPSGAGEMYPLALYVQGAELIVTLASGVAGRSYIVEVSYETYFERESWLITVPVSDELEQYPPVYPPSPFFGTAMTWPIIVGWVGIPIFGTPFPPEPRRYIVNPALLGRF